MRNRDDRPNPRRLRHRHTAGSGGGIALLVGLLTAPGVPADQEALEEVVVLGSYLTGDAYRSGTQLSVDREDLELVRPAEPEQLLQRLPGVSVFRPGGPGGVSEVFLRGAESNFTAVYVDGVRLNNPANTRGGSFDFSTLSVGEIERIDIAMGAMSAIYGSDAMAGVIRIETAMPEAGQGSVHAERGTESDWRAGAAGSVALGDSAVLGVRLSALDGGDAIEGSSLEHVSAAARLGGERMDGSPWRLDLRYVDRTRTSFPEVSGGPDLALLPGLESADGTQASIAATTGWRISDRWHSEFIASWSDIEDEVATPAVPPGELDGQPAFTSDSEYRRAQALWINRITPGHRSGLAFGVDLVDESGHDSGTVDLGFAVLPSAYRLDRTSIAAFMELGNAWSDRVRSTLAIRLDHADHDLRASGKLGVVRDLDGSGNRLWARIANGFKLPSFFALGNPLFGNPQLKPEKVRSLEFGYDRSLVAGIDAGLSVFVSEYEDLVDFDFESFTNVNRGEIDITGVSVHIRVPIGDTLHAGADATLADVSSESGPLRRRPEKTGGIVLSWQPDTRWSIDAAARYVGDRLITSIPTGDIVDGAYVFLDATARYRHSETLSAWLAIDNALDTEFQDAPGFPAPGPRARLGAEVRF